MVLLRNLGIVCYFYTWCAWDCKGVELDLCLRLFSEKYRSSFSQGPPPTIIFRKMFRNNNIQICDSLPRTVFDHRSLLGSWDPGLSTAATLNARRHAALAVLSLRLRAVTVCSKGQFPPHMKVFRSSRGAALLSPLCPFVGVDSILLFVGCFHVFLRLCLSTLFIYLLWVVISPVVVDVRSQSFISIHYSLQVLVCHFTSWSCLSCSCIFVSCLSLLWIPSVCALVFVSCRVCDQES